MFSQWNCEVYSGHIKPGNEKGDWHDLLPEVPVDGDGDGSEDTRKPGTSQGPGQKIEGTQEDALQEEHRVGVKEDWTKAEVVYFVESS